MMLLFCKKRIGAVVSTAWVLLMMVVVVVLLSSIVVVPTVVATEVSEEAKEDESMSSLPLPSFLRTTTNDNNNRNLQYMREHICDERDVNDTNVEIYRCYRNPGFYDGYRMHRFESYFFGRTKVCKEYCASTRVCFDPTWFPNIFDWDFYKQMHCGPHFYSILKIRNWLGWECGSCPGVTHEPYGPSSSSSTANNTNENEEDNNAANPDNNDRT